MAVGSPLGQWVSIQLILTPGRDAAENWGSLALLPLQRCNQEGSDAILTSGIDCIADLSNCDCLLAIVQLWRRVLVDREPPALLPIITILTDGEGQDFGHKLITIIE